MATKPRTIRKPATAKAAAAQKQATTDEVRATLEQKVIELHAMRKQSADLDIDIKKVQEEVVGLLDELGDNFAIVRTPDGPLRATRVQNTSDRLDEAALKNKVGSAMWKKITTLVLDKNKMKAFVASGEIDPLVVAQCTTTVTGNPFIRVS